MTSSLPPMPSDHTRHDPLFAVRAATGDLDSSEQPAAEALLAACGDCRALAADVQAIRHATAVLPSPRRTRDFRLTPSATADSRRSPLARLLDGGTLAFLQPLAGAAMAIGIALVVVTSLPLGTSTNSAPGAGGAGLPAPAAVPEASAATGGTYGASPQTDRGGRSNLGSASSPGTATVAPSIAPAKGGPALQGGEGASPEPTGAPEDSATSNVELYSTDGGVDLRVVGLAIAAIGLALLIATTLARRRVEASRLQ